MSVSLTKGQSVSLTKAASDAGATSPLNSLVAGAGWDAAADGTEIDLDLASIYLDANGKALADANGNGTNVDEAVTAYFQLENTGSKHSGDNLTGDGDGDDEQITFDLSAVPAEAKEIVVIVTSFTGQKFGDVKSAVVRMVNADGNTELAKYDLTDSYADAKAVEMGRIVRTADGWEFKATGEAKTGEPVEVFESYGVTGINA